MPTLLARACAIRGCPNKAAPGSARCVEHAGLRRQYERPRLSAADRGYDRKWRMTRARFLRAHPVCDCGRPATEVHHVVAREVGGSDEWANLRALCKACHSRITAKTQHKG